MKKDNILHLPKNESVTARSSFISTPTVENFLVWFSACIERKVFDKDLAEKSKALTVQSEDEATQIKCFFLEQVPKFRWPIKRNSKTRKAPCVDESKLPPSDPPASDEGDSAIDQAKSKLAKAMYDMTVAEIDCYNEVKDFGFEEGVDPFLIKESMRWPVDDVKGSPYEVNPLRIVNDYIRIHYPTKSDNTPDLYQLSSGKVLETLDIAMDAIEVLATKALTFFTHPHLGHGSTQDQTEAFSKALSSELLLITIKGWSRIHRVNPPQKHNIPMVELSLLGWSSLWHGYDKKAASIKNKESAVAISIASDMERFFYDHWRQLDISEKAIDERLNPDKGDFLNSMIHALKERPERWEAEKIFEFGLIAFCMTSIPTLTEQFWTDIGVIINSYNRDANQEGKSKAFPITTLGCLDWFGELSIYDPDEWKCDLHFDLLLGHIVTGYSYCWDGDSPELRAYYSNCRYAVMIEKSLDECNQDLAEALMLIQLHLSFFAGGTLEPWSRVGKAIRKTLQAGSGMLQEFVINLMKGYQDYLLDQGDRETLTYHYKCIMLMCRSKKMTNQTSANIISKLKEMRPISKEEAENNIREKLGVTYSKLADSTQSILIDSEYLFRQHRYQLSDKKMYYRTGIVL